MVKIKLTTATPSWPIERQTPGGLGNWNDCNFFVNKSDGVSDFWVVFDNLQQPETTLCPKGNTILITAEPPDVKQYPRGFVGQFGTVVTCQRSIRHSHIIFSQQALPWHVGRQQRNHENISFSKNYDELSSIRVFEKRYLLSTINSNKTITKGHQKRLKFIRNLSQYLGDQLDIFGRGVKEIEDKWDAIAPYRYHIVIENSSVPDYWTEKLSDSFLAGALPFYYGCPNISDYFPDGSFISIPLDAEIASHIIQSAISKKLYESSHDQLALARDLVLNQYNLFPMICNLINNMNLSGNPEPITIYPIAHFSPSAFAITLTKVRELAGRLIGLSH